ncbi:hypothetical protein [Pseudomonas oryzihabitans]|uniref:hypothetical protein n=1 Tax=Pseudomonas oryzihabitans TaxID=47885 RepID=UPI0005AACBA4|nr:hypothetical protein [Pseudomonas oryzihabitans]NMZ46031.1 hypothetical protein [Pseudomonas oryzihabitans]
MAKKKPSVVPFPSKPIALNQMDLSTRSIEADADLRASMLGDLLAQLAERGSGHPEELRLKVACDIAQELLDEMVTLYRRALSSSRRGNTQTTIV